MFITKSTFRCISFEFVVCFASITPVCFTVEKNLLTVSGNIIYDIEFELTHRTSLYAMFFFLKNETEINSKNEENDEK